MLAGSPIYLFAYVAVVLNAAYAALYLDQRARFTATASALLTGAHGRGISEANGP